MFWIGIFMGAKACMAPMSPTPLCTNIRIFDHSMCICDFTCCIIAASNILLSVFNCTIYIRTDILLNKSRLSSGVHTFTVPVHSIDWCSLIVHLDNHHCRNLTHKLFHYQNKMVTCTKMKTHIVYVQLCICTVVYIQ